MTPEARAHIERAEKLFMGVPDTTMMGWLTSLNATAESLHDSYGEGKPRRQTYTEMVDRILAPVRDGLRVCAAFYGHPGVFVTPSHEAIAIARSEGFHAEMLPGISALDGLYADLGVDPGLEGCQVFEATDLILRRRRFDPRNKLILLQIGLVGVTTWERGTMWSRRGLRVLTDVLLQDYPEDHEVIVYESHMAVVVPPRMDRVPLASLPEAEMTANCTLYVPPHGDAEIDPERAEQLGLPLPT